MAAPGQLQPPLQGRWNPVIPQDPYTSAALLTVFLTQFQSEPTAPYIHPNPISWTKDLDKANWAGSLPEGDAEDRDFFTTWWCASKGGKQCWIGLFSMWRSTWVGTDWDREPWHVWGAAVIKPQQGTGKYLMIWDCDPRDPYIPEGTLKRPRDFLLPVQMKLVDFIRQNRQAQINGLFYHTNQRVQGRDRCLPYTCEWVLEMAEWGDMPFVGFDEEGRSLDPRTTDCVWIDRW